MNKITKAEFIRQLSNNESYLLMGGSKTVECANRIMNNCDAYPPLGGKRTCVRANNEYMTFAIEGETEHSHLGLRANGERVEYLSDGKHYARCQYWTDSAGFEYNMLVLYRLAV